MRGGGGYALERRRTQLNCQPQAWDAYRKSDLISQSQAVIREARALAYILDDRPFIAISQNGRFAQFAYNILPGKRRGFLLWFSAVWIFAKATWSHLS